VSNLRGEAANWQQQKLSRVVVAGKIIKNRIICSYQKIILIKLQ